MRILFTTGNAYLPQIAGGAQSSTHQLATELRKHGHHPAVLCKLRGGDWTAFRARVNKRLKRKLFARDERMGYPVFRAWDPTAATEVAERFRPDVAVVQNGDTMKIASSLESSGIPVVLYFRNVEFDELGGNPADLRLASYISNSQFTAARYKQAFGVSSTVIPPLIDASLYRTTSSRENVTFINPYPIKGVDLAIEIARRCPDIPFSFNESWALNDEYKRTLLRRLQELPNVALYSRTYNMRSVYGKARVVLMPSKWEEAWGRVASEAQFSGIPVLGSTRGGLPESIGEGGIVLDYDAPLDDWVAALRRLWDDDACYARLSAAALRHSKRPELNPGHQFATFLEVLQLAAFGAKAA
ncbi:glycosyltransferase family 4 protein [Mesorhizobium sp. BAC0120]|uniref:glycosyltransferase family 4 protein n=1 Tax=Mesorhizobium sp. BAC0120 TaxID=3090670 RepID=UPI00298CAA43|nr:glycosyltransferase family 4 protein [Mesorhizobium sp. BAC0120]MDW6023930.1 glycosyltransferase family 4 protein [Mesorhizobium sp. BAC0120]